MQKIKNIIFDLGGVIINLDIPRTISAFNLLSNQPFELIYNQMQQLPLFDLFDKGQITEADFFNELSVLLGNNNSKQQLIDAWNIMLLDFPITRLQLLTTLKNNYRIFLLSNTNETHITAFEKILFEQHQYKNLDSFFERVYYSCRIALRKPDVEIFEFVLQQNNLLANETVFIDDSIQHVVGAQKLGIHSYLLEKGIEVGSLLNQLNIR